MNNNNIIVSFCVTVRFKQNNFISSKMNDHGKQIDISRLVSMLRGYVSKSSAALNPLTITQLACELSMRGRPVADGVAWPIPSISGAHAHYAYNSTAHAYARTHVLQSSS